MGPFGRGGWSPSGGAATVDWLTLLALIAAAVFFVLWMVERRKGGPQAERDSSIDILKSRYARGEIDRREFDEKRRDLL
jgi:putative membrane protein